MLGPCRNGRCIRPELLDWLAPDQARANLRDLTRLNRWFGGHHTVRSLLRPIVDLERSFSLLDIGAASGDLARCLSNAFPRSQTLCLDRVPFHLDGAPSPRLVADAFRLPIVPKSFDFVLCSLFLHHFKDEQIVELLREFGAVARRHVLIIDLQRHPLPYHFLGITRPVFGWDPVTLHDGKRSVEAGFHLEELKSLARAAGFRRIEARSHHPWFRLSLVLSG